MAKELTDKERMFIDTLFDLTGAGVTMAEAKKKALEAAGYSSDIHPNTLMRRLADEISTRAKEDLAMRLPEVVAKVGNVLTNPTELGAKQVLDAASWIADRAGLVKVEQSTVNVKSEQGIIVLPPKKKIEE